MKGKKDFMKTIFSLSLILMMATACYAPKTKKLSEPTPVHKPEYQLAGTNEWNLNDEMSYSGGALTLWSQTATGNQFARLLKANEDYNKAIFELYRYHDEKVNPLRKERDDKLQVVKALESQRADTIAKWKQSIVAELLVTRKTRMEKAFTWFDSKLATTSEPFESIKVHMNQVFEKYCEAKIWDMLTDSDFLSTTYTDRPTPLAVCEKVYADLKLFSSEKNTAPCAPATSAEGKNYLKCFWNAAMNTKFMSKIDENGNLLQEGLYTLERSQQLAALENDEETLKQQLLQGVYASRLKNGYKPVGTSPVPDMFKPLITDSPNYDKTFAFFSADRMLRAVENREINELQFNRRSKLLALSSEDANKLWDFVQIVPTMLTSDNVRTPEEMLRLGEEIRTQLHELGFRKFASGQISANDVLYNQALVADQSAVEPTGFSTAALTIDDYSQGRVDTTEVTRDLDFAIALQRAKVLETEELYLKVYQLGARVDRCDETIALTNLFCAREAATVRKRKTVQEEAPIAADVLFARMSFLTKPIGDALIVKVKLGDQDKHLTGVGCLSLATGEQIECSAPLANSERAIAVNLDPASQQISVDIKILEPTRWGFIEGLKSDISINRIPSRDLIDKTLHLEILPNTMFGLIPFISGTASLRTRSGEQIRMGAVAYLIDDSLESKYLKDR